MSHETVSEDVEVMPRMDSGTLTALRGSIKKWQDIVDGEGDDLGSENCPLCERFPAINCGGCPVKEKIGERGCRGTPYMEWVELETSTAESDEEIEAARAMLNFLIGLLPSGEKP